MRELHVWLLKVSHICLTNVHQSRDFDLTPSFDAEIEVRTKCQ